MRYFKIVLYFLANAYAAYEEGDEYLLRFGDITRTTIRKSLRRIPDITIQLGSILDVDNDYIQFFLHQKTCPVTVSVYEITDSTDVDQRRNYVVSCSMDNLRVVSNKFAKKSGLFFFVILDAFHKNTFTDIFRDLWRRRAVFKIYLLTVVGIFIYDPFTYDKTGNFGKIVNIQKRNLSTIFKDMNGYPMRVQIFRSVYSKVVLDESNHVKYVEGADAKVAYLLSEIMNYSMILQDPDPELFG